VPPVRVTIPCPNATWVADERHATQSLLARSRKLYEGRWYESCDFWEFIHTIGINDAIAHAFAERQLRSPWPTTPANSRHSRPPTPWFSWSRCWEWRIPRHGDNPATDWFRPGREHAPELSDLALLIEALRGTRSGESSSPAYFHDPRRPLPLRFPQGYALGGTRGRVVPRAVQLGKPGDLQHRTRGLELLSPTRN